MEFSKAEWLEFVYTRRNEFHEQAKHEPQSEIHTYLLFRAHPLTGDPEGCSGVFPAAFVDDDNLDTVREGYQKMLQTYAIAGNAYGSIVLAEAWIADARRMPQGIKVRDCASRRSALIYGAHHQLFGCMAWMAYRDDEGAAEDWADFSELHATFSVLAETQPSSSHQAKARATIARVNALAGELAQSIG